MSRFIVLASALFVQSAFGQYLPCQCNSAGNYNINNIDLNAGMGGFNSLSTAGFNGINSINAVGINGINSLGGLNAAAMSYGGVNTLPVAASGPSLESLGGFGGYGTGEVQVTGNLPMSGSTNIAGSLPVLGNVLFNGNVPAGGVVTIVGSAPYCCC